MFGVKVRFHFPVRCWDKTRGTQNEIILHVHMYVCMYVCMSVCIGIGSVIWSQLSAELMFSLPQEQDSASRSRERDDVGERRGEIDRAPFTLQRKEECAIYMQRHLHPLRNI